MIQTSTVLQTAGPAEPWIILGFVSVYALLAVVVAWFAATDAAGEPPRRCPNCGRSHDPSYRYCSHCAARVVQ